MTGTFFERFFADHFGKDAVAGRVGQNFERLIEPLPLFVRKRRIGGEAFSLFDHGAEEVLRRGSIGTAPRSVIGRSPEAVPSGTIAEGVHDRGHATGQQHRRGQIGQREPETVLRVVAARIQVIEAHLVVVAFQAVLGARRENVSVWYHAGERWKSRPRRRIEELFRRNRAEKIGRLGDVAGDDGNFFGDDVPPETHQGVDRRIHGEKVRVDDRNGDFADMGAGSAAEERGLRVAEVPLRKLRLPFQNRRDAHFAKVRLPERRRRDRPASLAAPRRSGRTLRAACTPAPRSLQRRAGCSRCTPA